MTNMSKRGLLQSGALMTAGAVVSCATPGVAANVPATPFADPETYVTIAGSNEIFPVRRIYCIGRNYAAHAIEIGSDPTREPSFFTASHRCDPGRYALQSGRPCLSFADQELPLRSRTGGRLVQMRAQHSHRQGAGPGVWLRVGSGHDPQGLAARHGRSEKALGNRQEL